MKFLIALLLQALLISALSPSKTQTSRRNCLQIVTGAITASQLSLPALAKQSQEDLDKQNILKGYVSQA